MWSLAIQQHPCQLSSLAYCLTPLLVLKKLNGAIVAKDFLGSTDETNERYYAVPVGGALEAFVRTFNVTILAGFEPDFFAWCVHLMLRLASNCALVLPRTRVESAWSC